MKKLLMIMLVAGLLCMYGISAHAAQTLNIYLNKDALLNCDVATENIRIRPEGMVRVVRHALWPWDEDGIKWSMLVEIENISDEKIVIDENWLIACKENRDEIGTADYAFMYTTNAIQPGERTVLHTGVYPYAQVKHTNADVSVDVWNVEGLEDFADDIQRAELLRVRLSVRGKESNQNWPVMEIEPEVWVEENKICFRWINHTDRTVDFRTIGAVMSDEQKRIVDVIYTSLSRGATVSAGEELYFEKLLAPYISQEICNGASFVPFAFEYTNQ